MKVQILLDYIIPGGVQECLGHYIKKKLSYDVGIICTGAAIAFETGKQARVPIWADSLYLGWLARIVQNPKLYVKRYIQALRLFFVFYLCRVKKNIESWRVILDISGSFIL